MSMFKYFARISAILFFIFGLIGYVFLVKLLLATSQQSNANKSWIQIQTPAEPLSTLRVGDHGEVFAEGKNGGLYQFVVLPEPEWVNVQDTEKINLNPKCIPLSEENPHQVMMKSDLVKSYVTVDCGFGETGIYWDFNLLENGETWYFESTLNNYAELGKMGLVLLFPVGIALNGALYIIAFFFLVVDIIITIWQKLKKKTPDQTIRSTER